MTLPSIDNAGPQVVHLFGNDSADAIRVDQHYTSGMDTEPVACPQMYHLEMGVELMQKTWILTPKCLWIWRDSPEWMNISEWN